MFSAVAEQQSTKTRILGRTELYLFSGVEVGEEGVGAECGQTNNSTLLGNFKNDFFGLKRVSLSVANFYEKPSGFACCGIQCGPTPELS